MDEELIKTGDFAKMCAVTKKALYVYEAKGLLKPAVVKDNGYRYYRLEQVDQVATIRLLEKLGSSLQEVGDFFALKDLNERQKYLGKQQEAVEREMAELGKIKSSLEFFDQRISDLKQTGFKKVAVETCPEEYLEVSPSRYGVIVDDFEKAEISRFFKVVERKEGNYVKAAGKYACFYQEMENDDVAGNGPKALEYLRSKAKVVPPFYQEDFSSSVSGHDGSVIIKYSAKLDL